MATALKISPKYYLEKEETKVIKSIRHSNNLHKLINEYKDVDKIEASEKEIKNERINSLKVQFLEDKFSFLEGGVDALVVNSFDEALRLVFSSLALEGENIVNFNSKSFKPTVLAEFGIIVKSSPLHLVENLQDLIDEKTKAIYIETLNDEVAIPDFQKISAIARNNQIPLIVNNTSALAGFFSTPLKNGAHLVINDLTKILTTADSLTGAVIVDSGNFDWNNGIYKTLVSNPKANFSLIDYLRNRYTVNYKDAVSTDDALDLINDFDRIQSESGKTGTVATQLANWLLKFSSVTSVVYPGLKGSKEYFNALRYFKNGFGNKILFTIEGDLQDFEVFLFNLLRTKVILNEGKSAKYDIEYNKENSSISVTILSGTFEEISEDFLYGFNELSKYKKLFSSRFLFQ